MDFIEDTLDLAPFPAAVYEAVDHRLVAANAAAWQWVVDELPVDFDTGGWRERSGFTTAIGRAVEHGESQVQTEWGALRASHLPGGFELGRPDLVLASLHRNPGGHARSAHRQVVLAFRVNESNQRTLSALDDIAAQASAALATHRRTMTEFVEEMRGFFAFCDSSEKSSAGS